MNHILLYPKVVEHLVHRSRHGRRPAEVVLDILRGIMLAEVLIIYHLMDEALSPCLVVLWLRIGEGYGKGEIRELAGYRLKVLLVEDLPPGACTVPE